MTRSVKGQFQMGEMVLVLVVVIFLAIGGIAFLLQRAEVTNTRSQTDQEQKQHAALARYISTMPALKASLAGYEDMIAIDWIRARQFAQLIKEEPYRRTYAERFTGYSVTLEPVYPPSDAYENYAPPANDPVFFQLHLFDMINSEDAKDNSIPFVIPVLLYDPYSERSAFGLMTIVQVTP